VEKELDYRESKNRRKQRYQSEATRMLRNDHGALKYSNTGGNGE